MIICLCHRVSDRDIARAAQQGCASFEQLQARTGVATGCGRCRECAHDRFQAQRQAVLAGDLGHGHGHAHPPPAWAAQPVLACA